MFSEIEVKEPLEKVIDDWDFLTEKVFARYASFRDIGSSILGLRRRIITPTGLIDPKKGPLSKMVELDAGGIGEGGMGSFQLRITAAGTPHRSAHNFGYWHINDQDELYVPIPAASEGEEGFFVVLMGQPKGKDTDAFAWYCENCLTLLYEHVARTGNTGIAGFWKAERAAVSAYNGDARLRRCVECGHVNPLGYCWNSAKDTPEEAEARAYW